MAGSAAFAGDLLKDVLKISGDHLSASGAFVVVGQARSVVGDVEVDPGEDKGMLSHVDKLNEDHFDILMVDNDWKIIPRDDLLFKAIPKLNKKRAIIIMDNYGSPACFPVTYSWSMERFISELLDDKWQGEEFNSIWWGGLGTRIFHKGFFEKKVIKENKKGSARWFKI